MTITAPHCRVSDLADEALQQLPALRPPDIVGRSKELWLVGDALCYVRLIPSLRSFTYARDESYPETGPLRLDFFEKAAHRLHAAGLPTAFIRRITATSYLAHYRPAPPFEVIVKNRATGSTLRKYPGLFAANSPLPRPVVKFDYRCEPEDQPIGEDYLRLLGVPVDAFAQLARRVNEELRSWLAPLDLWDFCLIIAESTDHRPLVISEISPDCMRLRRPDGSALDKDLFRDGESRDAIVCAWQGLVDGLT